MSFSEHYARDVLFAGGGTVRETESVPGVMIRSFAPALGRSPYQQRTVPAPEAVFADLPGGLLSGAPGTQPWEDWSGAAPAGEEERGYALLAGTFAAAVVQELARLFCDRTDESENERRHTQLPAEG